MMMCGGDLSLVDKQEQVADDDEIVILKLGIFGKCS